MPVTIQYAVDACMYTYIDTYTHIKQIHIDANAHELSMAVKKATSCKPLMAFARFLFAASERTQNGAETFSGEDSANPCLPFVVLGTTTKASTDDAGEREVTDVAHQIKHSTLYKNEWGRASLSFDSRSAEWFSGLPRGGTSPKVGAVDAAVFMSMFHEALKKADTLPVVALFSGMGGLDVGMSTSLCATDYVECTHSADAALLRCEKF